MHVCVSEGRGKGSEEKRRGALNKQRGVDICNFRHTLVSNSHRAHSRIRIRQYGKGSE